MSLCRSVITIASFDESKISALSRSWSPNRRHCVMSDPIMTMLVGTPAGSRITVTYQRNRQRPCAVATWYSISLGMADRENVPSR